MEAQILELSAPSSAPGLQEADTIKAQLPQLSEQAAKEKAELERKLVVAQVSGGSLPTISRSAGWHSHMQVSCDP